MRLHLLSVQQVLLTLSLGQGGGGGNKGQEADACPVQGPTRTWHRRNAGARNAVAQGLPCHLPPRHPPLVALPRAPPVRSPAQHFCHLIQDLIFDLCKLKASTNPQVLAAI